MAIRNNSGPYILPRRLSNNARPRTLIALRNQQPLRIQPRHSQLLSETVTKSSSQPLRVVARIIDPMTLGCSRQLFLSPTSAVLSPVEQHLNTQPVHDSFRRSFSHEQKAPIYKQAEDQFEEEGFDMDEVYQLLDENAGYRAQELGMPRRRERLSNLTPEEKMNRRKHKNRIAAQAARDRKKVNTNRLEESLRRALLEIGRLRGEVNLLRAENARLEAENQTIQSGPERRGLEEYDIDSFQQQSKQKGQQQFHPQPMHSHQQTADMKPSFLVCSQSAEKLQRKTGGVGQRDSVGSAASFHEPLQRERESSKANSGSGKPRWTEKKVSAMACVAKLKPGIWPHDSGTHGTVVGGEDVELQKIFDELFEDFDFPVDVDRFCNEVIEEGIAEPSDAFGAIKTSTTQKQQTNCHNDCVPSTDATESEAQSPAQNAHTERVRTLDWQQFGDGRELQHDGFGNSATVAAALSPHNYFVQPEQTTAPPSVCAPSVSTSNSLSNNSSSPSYQKVPSPCLSSHSTYIDELSSAFDDDQHQIARDPLLSSMKQEYLDQFDDHFRPVSSSYDFEEPTCLMMSNAFDSFGAEESCALEEVVMSEIPTGEGQQELLHVDGLIGFYPHPSSNFSSNQPTFLSY